MTLTPLIAVPGTWEWPTANADVWYAPTSPFAGYLATQGWTWARGQDERPYVWSTRATGYQFWDRLLSREAQMLADWEAAATNLFAWVVPPNAPECRIPPEQTTLLTHSHGIQVALLAAAQGLKIQTLIDVCGPVRRDIDRRLTAAARANIGYWWHIHADRSDWWQVLGSVNDGALGLQRQQPRADLNQRIPRAGHSRILRDEAWMPLLDSVLDYAQQRYNVT
ncbi:MAG: hypothetical protein EBS05_24835 [Proteobacteria bacterium]|nr:hypothetical protein [Pseudomonadota bacterium]